VKWAILGGGLTGVTVGRLLRERGEEVVILEKEERCGGLCRSLQVNGFTFDIGGSHIIFSRDTAVLDYMRSVLGENRGERDRNTKIFYGDRYVKYPFENGLSDLPREDCFFCLNEFIRTLISAEKGTLPPPANFRDWIYQTFGRGIAELYMVPYNEKIWKYPPEEMSAHWVEGRVPRPPVEDIVRSAIGIETEGYTHQSVFSYPVWGGIESLIKSIAEPVSDAIRTGFCVSEVRKEDGHFVISDGSEQIRADRLISTIPVPHLLECLADVPEEVGGAAADLVANSLICVCVGVKGEVPGYSWVYVPQHDIGAFNRISFPSNYSVAVAPEGHASILVEITFQKGDEMGEWPDEKLTRHALEGLCRMGVIRSEEDVVMTHVERQPFAYVVYDLDYQDNIRTVREFCRANGITLLGRFSEFEYLNMDGVIRRVFDWMEAME
jgi:protoporphyrinogen oxidase